MASCSDAMSRVGIMRIAEERALGGGRAARGTYFGDRPWDLRASCELRYGFVAVGDRGVAGVLPRLQGSRGGWDSAPRRRRLRHRAPRLWSRGDAARASPGSGDRRSRWNGSAWTATGVYGRSLVDRRES